MQRRDEIKMKMKVKSILNNKNKTNITMNGTENKVKYK